MPEPVLPPDRDQLDRECRVFCRYLVNREPGAYVLGKYYDAHVATAGRDALPAALFDAWLLSTGKTHPLLTRLADVYARFVRPRTELRRKLILLLAILESCAPTDAEFHLSHAVYTPIVLVRLLGYGLNCGITLGAAFMVFLPLHLAAGFAARRRTHAVAPLTTPDRA
jgi:hypothetical protein